jgi:hypothetical protein
MSDFCEATRSRRKLPSGPTRSVPTLRASKGSVIVRICVASHRAGRRDFSVDEPDNLSYLVSDEMSGSGLRAG